MEQAKPLQFPKRQRGQKKPSSHKRRQRGTGSFFRPKYKTVSGAVRQSDFWWIKYTDKATKQVYQENTRQGTKDGAVDLLNERLGAIATGAFAGLRFQDVTLAELFEALRTRYRLKERRSGKKLERSLRRLESFFGAGCKAIFVTPDRITAYTAARLEEDVAMPTVSRELAALKTAFRLGLRNGKVQRVPNIEIPKEEHRARDGEFSREQFAALMGELPDYLKPVVDFLYLTGCRVSEPLSMCWPEVNFAAGVIRMPARKTKTGVPKTIPLTGRVMAIIQAQKEIRDAKFPTCEHVFFTQRGCRIGDVYDALHAASERAGITFQEWDGSPRKPGFHDLRRTFARNARRAGMADSEIMDLGGWETQAMLRRYLGRDEAQLKIAQAKLESFLA